MIWTISPRTAPSLVDQVLANRQVTDRESFLCPSLRSLHDPFLIHNMEKAAMRIVDAFKNKERIIIAGDYDCDGLTGTAALVLTLRMLGADVGYHIPNREEGYGLQEVSVGRLIDEGAKLIVSVDCGITAVGPAKVCRDRGVDLIVTDHHEWKEELPYCYCIVHPRFGDSWFPNPADTTTIKTHVYENPHLCGSGVAFKLAWAIGKTMNGGVQVAPENIPFFMNLLAFTALGTVADCVPLLGENRVIVYHGLERLKDSCFPGLRAFVSSINPDGKDLSADAISFQIGPRLNAASRMGDASRAMKMLLSDNFEAALAIAADLDEANKQRQTVERKMAKEAKAQYEKTGPADFIIVRDDYFPSVGPTWSKGVMGIVASRLAEEYHKPCIVFVGDGGSGRSVEGFKLIAALDSCADLLDRYGGHEMAAGVHLKHGKYDEFRKRMNAYARDHTTPAMKAPSIIVECTAILDELTEDVVIDIKRCGPFGSGNRRPYFCFKDVQILETRRMGKDGQFLSFVGTQDGVAFKFVWFKPVAELAVGMIVDVLGEPEINEWKGTKSVQIMVKDVRLPEKENMLLVA